MIIHVMKPLAVTELLSSVAGDPASCIESFLEELPKRVELFLV